MRYFWLFFSLFLPTAVLAQAKPSAIGAAGGLLNTLTSASGFDTGRPLLPEEVVANLIVVALSLIGIFLVALIIYGGYLWGNARGNEEQVERAQNLIRDAVIGLIIILLSYFIAAFVVARIGEVIFDPAFL